MKSNLVYVILLSALFMFGCKSAEVTVREMRNTIKDARTRDYETARVTFSKKKDLNRSTLTTRIERFMDAENNAAVYLGEPKPFPDVKKSAAAAVIKALEE